MNTARVLDNGDLRLPPEVADKLHVKPGDSVGVEVESDGTARLYPRPATVDEVCGMLRPPPGVHFTIEQMDETVAEAIAEHAKPLSIPEFIRRTEGIRQRTASCPQTDSAILVREDRER